MAQVMDVTALLVAAQSADATTRQQAEVGLAQLEAQPSAFFLSLSAHLSNEANPVDTRRLAGIVLKNALDGREEGKKAAQVAQWLGLDGAIKQQVRAATLSALAATAQHVGQSAAVAVSKIAAVDLPHNAWPDLIPTLLHNSAPGAQPALRHSTFQALGYVCEELGVLEEDYLDQQQVNAILTAVVGGMRQAEQDQNVRLAATQALDNALDFAHANFGNEAERNHIMQIVCEGTLAADEGVQKASWQCIVHIAEAHYSRLPAYMADLFHLSQLAVRSGAESVALQALEFWCTIAEEEAERCGEQGEVATDDSVCHNFMRAALPQLVPLLLEQLTKQEEGQETEDGAQNVSLLAGTALGLTAAVVGDAVVELVMPYVQENIQKNAGPEDWRAREAATFAFGSIMRGPSPDTLSGLVRTGLPFLLSALRDPHPQVKNTIAWTIGRIFEFVHSADIDPPLLGADNLSGVVTSLLEAIRDEPHISEKVCYAISQLANGFRDANPSPLSPHFQVLVGALLETAARPLAVAEAVRLQTQAFEAVNEVVRASSPEAAPLVAQLLPVALGKLAEVLAVASQGGDAAERQDDLAGLLCGVLQVAVQKLTEGGEEASQRMVLEYADPIMEALLRVLTTRPGAFAEAMLAVGAMTNACEGQFLKYMDALFPVLERGLQQHQDWQSCQITVGVVSDVCRAVEGAIFPYCDRLMLVLLQNLQSDEVHRSVKPAILQAFGDIALATEDRFEVYLVHVIQMLQSAAGLAVQQQAAAAEDEDLADYNNLLRQGILEAWAAMFNGLSKQRAEQYLSQYAPSVIEFVEAIAGDMDNADEGVLKAAVALLGDVAAKLTGVGVLFQQKPFVRTFLQQCAESSDLEDLAKWAAVMVGRAEGATVKA